MNQRLRRGAGSITAVALFGAGLGLAVPGAASAASPITAKPAAAARLASSYAVAEKITASKNGTAVGTKVSTHFAFKPSCKTGACKTTLSRVRTDGVKVSYPVVPNAKGTYTGSGTYVASCFLNGGGTVAKAYTYKESISFTTGTKSIKGSLHLTFAPTKVGTAHNCAAGSLTASFTGKS
jgi:hypothetical protein